MSAGVWALRRLQISALGLELIAGIARIVRFGILDVFHLIEE
ncbi:hypothetical protein [Sulfitobacter sediminis]